MNKSFPYGDECTLANILNSLNYNQLRIGKGIALLIQINRMKTIQNLIETLKDLISEATQGRTNNNDLRLIPIPVRNQERNIPGNRNNH